MLESVGVAIALTLALLAVWHIDATDRSWMLYYEGDSVLPAIVRGSVLSGQQQDWALSAVLFLPEMGMYYALAALGLGVKGTFALSAVVNLVLFYGALRFLSGMVQRDLPRARRVTGALIAFGAMMALTFLEQSPQHEGFEFASLLATTTYYSVTVLAAVATTGMAARLAAAPDGSRRRWVELTLAGVSALSTLTNPLYVAWEVAPLAVVFGLMAWRRALSWRRIARIGCVLALGIGAGLAARIPFEPLILKDGPAYANFGLTRVMAIYYPEMLAERTSTITGAVSLTFIVALILVAAIVFRRSLAARDTVAAVVSGMGWLTPLAIFAGTIILGLYGTRYLQPMFFDPICLLVLAPRLFRSGQAADWLGRRLAARAATARARIARARRALIAGAAVAALGASAAATGALVSSGAVVNSDIACVDAWITASHQTGAGDFWAIRGPKAYLADPSQLIQVDGSFYAYPWLTDRVDYARPNVSFVLMDTAKPALTLPPEAQTAPSSTVRCGRYTITDFGSPVLPIGPIAPYLTS